MILAEDLLLLLLDDATGKPVTDSIKLDHALAGAVLLELATLGRVDVAGPGEEVRAGRLVVRDDAPTDDAVLTEALRRIATKGPRTPKASLRTLTKNLREDLLARLADRGVVRLQEGKVLGLFPTRAWPAADSRHEDHVRQGLHDVLVVGRSPEPREAALISLLHAVDQVPNLLADSGIEKRELKRRAKAVADGDFAGEAVRTAVRDVQLAVMTGVMVATTAAASSSSG